jgi:hypothetical protein
VTRQHVPSSFETTDYREIFIPLPPWFDISHCIPVSLDKIACISPDSTPPVNMQNEAPDSARISLLGMDAVMLQANFVSDQI